jgi:hypothetical protein
MSSVTPTHKISTAVVALITVIAARQRRKRAFHQYPTWTPRDINNKGQRQMGPMSAVWRVQSKGIESMAKTHVALKDPLRQNILLKKKCLREINKFRLVRQEGCETVK